VDDGRFARCGLVRRDGCRTRVRQIELNMERWRWLPRELGDRYILVNIANFTLDVIY
jgi:murein L,D-transpeptidase YcbB/YkuD